MSTLMIPGTDVAARLSELLPGAIIEADEHSVTVPAERAYEVAMFLRDDEVFDCKYLNCLTGIDWMEHFDVVYVVSSMAKNQLLTFEARTGHDDPVVPTVSNVWQGANLQEREVYDLMGISFAGHPNQKRIFLWEGFPGHPLRKDFLTLPAGYKPGLQRFPFEFPPGQRNYPSLAAEGEPQAPAVPRLVPPLPGQVAAQPLGGGQLGVRGGGATHTRAPGGMEPAPPLNRGGAGNPDVELGSTGGGTPLSNADSESEAGGGSGYRGSGEEHAGEDQGEAQEDKA